MQLGPDAREALIARTTSRFEPLGSKEAIGWGSSDRVGLEWVGLERSSGARRAIEWGSSDRVGLERSGGARAIGWGSAKLLDRRAIEWGSSDRVGLEPRRRGKTSVFRRTTIGWGSNLETVRAMTTLLLGAAALVSVFHLRAHACACWAGRFFIQAKNVFQGESCGTTYFWSA